MGNLKYIRYGLPVVVGSICSNGGRLPVILDKRVSRISHEKDEFLRISVTIKSVKVYYAQSCCHWRICDQIFKQWKYALVLAHHIVNCNVGYVVCLGVGSLDIR